MRRRAALVALGLVNAALLIATSGGGSWAEHRSSPFTAVLGPQSPRLYLDGAVEAGPVVDHLTLGVLFDGNNRAPEPGQVSLYALIDGEIPSEAQPLATQAIPAKG